MITISEKSAFTKAITFIRNHNLIPSGSHIIVGLSGGPDSIFLLHFLHHIAPEHALKLTAVHLDHGWRTDSQKDVIFCRELCQGLGIPFIARHISDLGVSLKMNGSQEELGRHYRRHFFNEIKKEHNADTVALGHHADDQMETFFIRLLRGSSLTGLTGMQAKDGHYIRPLLGLRKKDILDYLHEHKYEYLIDSTNDSPKFLRNRIRHQLIPALRGCDERVDTTFFTTLAHLQNAEELLTLITQDYWKKIHILQETTALVSIDELLAHPRSMQYRLLIAWLTHAKVPFAPSQAFFDEILRFLKNPEKEHRIHQAWSLIKTANQKHVHIRLNQ